MGGQGIGHKERRARELGMSLDVYLAMLATHKWCCRCKAFHPLAFFVSDASRPDGLAAKCAPPATAPGPARPDRIAMRARGWFWCAECEAWWPLDWRVNGRCKPHERAVQREHYARTPRIAAQKMARSRKIAYISPELREEVMERTNGRCAYCPAPATTLDHFWPVVHGGGAMARGNVVPACRPCNSRKKDTTNLGPWLNDDTLDLVVPALLRFAMYDGCQEECCNA